MVPAGAMIFELPYMPFPEGSQQPGQRRADYDAVAAELSFAHAALELSHDARSLGRRVGRGHRRATARQIDRASRRRWFRRDLHRPIGLHRRRSRPSKRRSRKSSVLRRSLTPDRSLLFFDLSAYERRVHAGLTAAERERRRDLALHPVLVRWLGGCYRPEHEAEGPLSAGVPRTRRLEIGNDAAGRSVRRRALLGLCGRSARPR